VAVSAIGRELLCNVIGISGHIIVIGMASGTGIGRIVVVSVMTCRAIACNHRMCTSQEIIVVVYRK
jgi:hypothetical protein